MSDVSIHLDQSALEELYKSKDVVQALRAEAEKVRGRVRAPAHLTVSTRAGVSSRGAFSQVILSGPGALSWEFGSRSHAPHATLRSAIGGG